MAILVNVDFEMANKYNVRSISTKYNNKKHKVYFKLCCDDFNLSEALNAAKVNHNVIMVEYKGSLNNPEFLNLTESTGLYIGRMFELGNNICEQDLQDISEDVPNGVTPIVYLPSDFKDLELLVRLSRKFPRFRFCGGQLFAVEGVKLGAVGVDTLEAHDIKFGVECYNMTDSVDVIETVDILDLELEVSNKPERTTKTTAKSTTKSSSSTPKKPKTMMFSDIFNRNESVMP